MSALLADAGGKLLNHVKTVDTINDMESIRKALGKSQINFYGFSYGSYLGNTYANMFPKNVRALVIDAAGEGSIITPGPRSASPPRAACR